MSRPTRFEESAAERRRRDEERRRSAEQRLRSRLESAPALADHELPRLVHELQVHQIELEMQNEELLTTRVELEASLERYADLYDFAPVSYLTLRGDGEIVEANLTAAALLGVERAELIGQRLGVFATAGTRPSLNAFLAAVRAGQGASSCEITLALEGREPRQARLHGGGARGCADRERLCRVVMEDITERKRIQAQVAQSDRLASMGLLAAGVAHEINNPLTYTLLNLERVAGKLTELGRALENCRRLLIERLGARAFAELMGSDGEAIDAAPLEEMNARLREALEGAKRVRDVTRGLSTFSRLDQNSLSFVDLGRVIEIAINMVFNEIKFRARVVKDFGPAPVVMASEGRLSQVVLNLLINAAHSIEEGDLEHNEIRIRTWAEGGEALLEVRDTGKGIAPEHIDRLFDPFFTTKPVGVGTGLGLSICHNIVTGYGGRIEVWSELGRGTTFLVRLPLAGREDKVAGASGAIEPEPTFAVRGRILIVDDEPVVRDSLCQTLAPEHEVVEADSGRQAKAILEKDRRFHVILCDLVMPEISGADLHEWLAEKHPDLAPRMVFITGGVFTPRITEYLGKVGNLCVEKPFDTAGLKKMVVELIAAAEKEEA